MKTPPAPPKSVLIVRLSAIGDVVHALPFVDALKAQLPGVRVGWVVEELAAPLLENHPQIDTVYTIPKKRWRKNWRSLWRSEISPFVRQIRNDGWDAAVDLQGLTKSAAAAFLSGAKRRVGFRGANAREVSTLLYTHRVRPTAEDVHVVRQTLRLLEGLGLEVPTAPPRGVMGITEAERRAMAEKLRAHGWDGMPFLVLNPGAGWVTKRWPAASFARLGELLAARTGLRPVVLWGPGEESVRDEIVSSMKECGVMAAPPTRVRELAVIISMASLLVGGDTGASHLAGLLDVPTLALFGASDLLRNAPWGNIGGELRALSLQRRDLPCVPCWKTKCPLTGGEHLQCLHQLTPEWVMVQAKYALHLWFPEGGGA